MKFLAPDRPRAAAARTFSSARSVSAAPAFTEERSVFKLAFLISLSIATAAVVRRRRPCSGSKVLARSFLALVSY